MEIINTTVLRKLLDKNKRLFEGLLPELIKRLILANKDGIKHIRIPGKDDVWAPGFDGIVENDIARLFLAKGTSVWEFGTCEHSLEKINSDYQKRTNNSLEIDKKEATFYFVLPKIWASKKMSISEWENSKTDWKAVKIIDGSILSTWLNQEIDVAIWFLESCAEASDLEITSVKKAWEKLSERTEPHLNHDLFLNGRDEFKQRLINAINSQAVIRVKSDTLIDAFGFTLSTLLENTKLKETVIVVENLNSYKKIIKLATDKTLLLFFNYEGEVDKSNKTILLYNKEITAVSVDFEIPQMRKQSIAQALKSMGIDDVKAGKIIDGTHRNLLAIIRRIASETFRDNPKWAGKDDKIFLMPLLLMNKINTSSVYHKNIVELLSGKTYSEFEQKMKVLLLLEDSPIKQVDNFYCIMCYEEAWNILQLKTNEIGFNNMVKIIETVAYYCAEKYNEIDSGFIGIANAKTLQEVPLKEYFESIVHYSYIDDFSKNNIEKLIYDILKECNHPNVFRLFSNHFSLFAEAAPSVMANYLEEQVKIEDSLVLQMMSEVDYGSDYCRILWALNVLTFFDETKITACNILAKLMFRQIKYKISNSPEDSLLNTLCLWYTGNALTLDEKKKIILKFLKSNPIEFAPFVVKLFGKNIVVTSGGPKVEPRKAEDRVFLKEYFETINEIVNAVIGIALQNKDLSLIQNIVDEYKVLYPETLAKISEEINRENFDEQPLWEFNFHVMRKISDIRKYGNCEAWEGSKEYLPALNALCEKTKSEDIILQNACYFKNFYHCPIINDDEFNGNNDFEKEDRDRKEFRKNIFYTLKKELGNDFNYRIVAIMNDEWSWGVFLNEVTEPKEFDSLCDELMRINKNLILSGLLNSANVDLVKNKIDKELGNLQVKIISLLNRFDLIEILDTEEKRIAFWQNKELWEFNQEIFDAIYKYNPIGLLNYYYRTKVNSLNCETVIAILEKILEHQQINKNNYYNHIITDLFNQCDAIFYSEKLALVEYEYYKAKDGGSFPNGLCRYWFENPQEIVKFLIPFQQENYGIYYHIGYDYRLPSVAYKDEYKFNFFFESILKTAITMEDREAMLSILGKIMGRSEKGNDGIFPHELVRKKLQKLDNRALNNGFIIGKLNTIGVRWIADGESERKIAINYRNDARQIAIDYPVTSSLLNRLADSFDKDARSDYLYSEIGHYD